MPLSSRRAILPALALALLALVAADARASVRVAASAIRAPAFAARGVVLRIEPGAVEHDAVARLRLEAESVQPTDSDSPWTRVVLSCALERASVGWTCPGRLVARSGGASIDAAVTVSSDPDQALVALDGGGARLAYGGTPERRRLTAHSVPIAWLQPLVAALLTGAKASGGAIDVDLSIAPAKLEGSWALHRLDLDRADGELATGALEANGHIERAGSVTRVAAELVAGEWLFAPLYVKLEGAPVKVDAALRSGAQGVALESLHWRDPGTLALDASAAFDADGVVQAATVENVVAEFPAAFARYVAAVVAPSGFGDLTTSGRLTGRFDWQRGAEPQVSLATSDLALADAAGRFAIDGLALDLAFNRARTEPSRLGWAQARLYRLPVGALKAELDLAPGKWQLDAPVELPAFGGGVRVERLTRTLDADGAARWEGGVTARAIGLEPLSEALGWPRFRGVLDAQLPGFHYDGSLVRVDGALTLAAFGGSASISEVALERPFGVAPSLAAQVRFDDLDLAELTAALSFGSIEGRLDGAIRDLRLVDWSPVTLDASFRTDDAYKGDRRISQRAVNSLALVGGSGGVSAGLLKVFEKFSYDAIGLSCRLERNVCHMQGLEADAGGDAPGRAGGGYTIVRGSGLPRLTIVGHQREVDWPVLVSRLETATRDGPVVK